MAEEFPLSCKSFGSGSQITATDQKVQFISLWAAVALVPLHCFLTSAMLRHLLCWQTQEKALFFELEVKRAETLHLRGFHVINLYISM